MAVILVYSERPNGEREVAGALAEQLGYRLITPQVVIERAAAWGGSQRKLVRVLTEPRSFDRFLREPRALVLLLRAALAEEIRNGDVICYGELAHLLLQGYVAAIRIGICSSLESRIRTVSCLRKVSEPEAKTILRHADMVRKAWLRLIRGERQPEVAPDLTLNLERIDFTEVCEVILGFVRRVAKTWRSIDNALLDSLALSTRVEAALATAPATAHLELAVGEDRGRITIHGRTRNPQDPIEVQRVVQSIKGVSQIALNGEVLREREAVPATPRQRQFTVLGARPAYLALGLTLAGVLAFSVLAGRFGSLLEHAAYARWLRTPEVFQGMITDSRCGIHHSQAESARCVRACVAQGAKYMLDDGGNLYELSDQRDADSYAGRKVRVRGFLGEDSRYLKVSSMQPF